MSKIINVLLTVAAILFVVGYVSASLIYSKHHKEEKKEQRSCVVVSTNITLMPAKPNTVTILRNGTKETCYIYKDEPVENEDAMSN
jgi:flagellar basal body-associated protein FliL